MSLPSNPTSADADPNAPLAQHAPRASWSDMGESEHFVQFYEDDAFLVDSVGAFIGAALGAGDSAIVIATPAHRDALDMRLKAHGFNLAVIKMRVQYIALDAAETLAKFMVDGLPDPTLFNEVVGGAVARTSKGQRNLRAFGEMVALLWAEGNSAAAIRLEELWNELGKIHRFALFCAYPMAGFSATAHGQPLTHICNAHSRVIPAESYNAQVSFDDRLRTITILQHKAAALEAEVAERKNAESGLREEQTKLTMAVGVAGLGVWELDLQTNAFSCSVQCKAHFGLTPDEPLTYIRAFSLIHPDDRERVQNALRMAVDANVDYNIEYRIINPAGRLRWIAAMGRCFRNDKYRMLGVTLDITERKQAAEILEQTVAERTRDLQETIAELESFSYSISHDMRAPLRSMHGFADILMDEYGDLLDNHGRTYLQRITSAAARMDRLIQDVLTFSCAVRSEFDLEPVNLEHLVCGILDCYPNLQPPQADITVEGTLLPVLGNEAALTQCLANLLSNAVKFVPPGTQPRIRVWSELVSGQQPDAQGAPSNPQASWVRLSIQDNGIGIPIEAQEKIFAMFQRLSKTHEGTGIGLAIVKKTAERMGGRVGVTSELDKGSTFWVELRHACSPLHEMPYKVSAQS
ncbi:MAG TPA: ATP-binding protein [Gammaproteobacteria bacterium]|nr:ATP-binding protein [Gammaproteobacteria bacterium]